MFGCSEEELFTFEEIAKQGNENFLKELEERTANFTDKEFVTFERIMKRRGRAAAPAIAAPVGAAPAQPTSTGTFMPSTMPELRGRDNLGPFLKRFRLGRA